MITIEAFTFDYDEVEDRIRISGNLYNGLSAVSFWLTRKLTLKMLDAAESIIHQTSSAIAKAPAEHQSAMAHFEHQNAELVLANKIQNHASTNESALRDFQLNAVETQLLQRLDISYKSNQYSFMFYGINDKPIAKSVIAYDELHQLLSLIHRGALYLGWGVNEQLFVANNNKEYTLQ